MFEAYRLAGQRHFLPHQQYVVLESMLSAQVIVQFKEGGAVQLVSLHPLRLALLFGMIFGIAAEQAAAQPQTPDPEEMMSPVAKVIRSRLDGQVAVWNAGDIDSFMRVYWRSSKLSFSSGGKVTRGWQKTLDGYRSRYPDKATMGKLSFSGLEVTELGDAAALVLGKWHLERKPPLENIGGNFSLVFRKLDGEWLIIHDHTSVLKKEE